MLFKLFKDILQSVDTDSHFERLNDVIAQAIDDERFQDLSDFVGSFDDHAKKIPPELTMLALSLTKIVQDKISNWEKIRDSIGSQLESDPEKRKQLLYGL